MRRVKNLLNEVKENGFKGVKPLYIDMETGWNDAYANFYIEFEYDEPEISEDFEDHLRDLFSDCDIIVKGTEFEILGPNFEDLENDYYDDYLLIDDIW